MQSMASLDFHGKKHLLGVPPCLWLVGGFKYFYFHPYLGKIPNLTNIFQMGWNHQLERGCEILLICFLTQKISVNRSLDVSKLSKFLVKSDSGHPSINLWYYSVSVFFY